MLLSDRHSESISMTRIERSTFTTERKRSIKCAFVSMSLLYLQVI